MHCPGKTLYAFICTLKLKEFRNKSRPILTIDIDLHFVGMEVVKNCTKCKPISPTCGHVLNFHSTVAFGAWPRPFYRCKVRTGIYLIIDFHLLQTLKDLHVYYSAILLHLFCSQSECWCQTLRVQKLWVQILLMHYWDFILHVGLFANIHTL